MASQAGMLSALTSGCQRRCMFGLCWDAECRPECSLAGDRRQDGMQGGRALKTMHALTDTHRLTAR